MTKASEVIRATFLFIPEVMQYQEILEQLLIKYATEACEEQKQICIESLVYGETQIINIEDSIINSPLPVFQ